MKLSKILAGCNTIIQKGTKKGTVPFFVPFGDIEILSLAFDSGQCQAGSLFFCLVGGKADGHDFAAQAEKNGAAAIVAQRQTNSRLPHILVKDTRKALSKASANFYHNPHKKLKLIGITGTNGKTTTTYIVKSILEAAGKKVGLIGTNEIIFDNQTIVSSLTTPDPTQFYNILSQMIFSGVQYVVMEVSAHALALEKMHGVTFDISAFTNFSQDHLDFFGDMDTYFKAKCKLFTAEYSKCCVFNIDDDRINEFALQCTLPNLTFGFNNPCDVFGVYEKINGAGLEFVLNLNDDIQKIECSLTGKFNSYNILCAAAVCGALGVDLKTIAKGVKKIKRIDGRFNVIKGAKCDIIIDFAHTADGLRNILTAVKSQAKGRIITVFGCGGDRDKEKRPLMGKTVSELSDYCFITSDNPRGEKPCNIINDIYQGFAVKNQTKAFLIVDRKQAIKQAIEFAETDDIILVAGKGAEQYIEVGGDKIPYNDEKYIKELMNNVG